MVFFVCCVRGSKSGYPVGVVFFSSCFCVLCWHFLPLLEVLTCFLCFPSDDLSKDDPLGPLFHVVVETFLSLMLWERPLDVFFVVLRFLAF